MNDQPPDSQPQQPPASQQSVTPPGPPPGGPGVPAAPEPYPVRLEIDYPDRPLDRLSTFFRIFWAIPIMIVLCAVGNALLVLPPLLLILFREKYPRWWFDWNLELARFQTRVDVYFALMDDRYPSTDEHQSVHLDIDFPDVPRDLNRWLPLVKWLLAIPHFIVLFFLGIAAFFVVIFAWFAILFTGRYPRGAFGFLVGVGRWYLRVEGYAMLMVTDRYPPFSLAP